mgnify:CR=1 FL=1
MLVAQRESGVMTTTAQNQPLPSDSNPIPGSAPVSATDGPWVRPGAGWIIARYVLLAGTMAAATLAPLLVTTPFTSLFERLMDQWEGWYAVYLAFVGILNALIAIALVRVIARRIDLSTLRRCGVIFDRATAPMLLLGVATAVVLGTGAAFGVGAFGLLRGDGGTDGYSTWVFIATQLILGLLVQGFPEELLFRGYLMRHVPLTIRSAIVLSASLFAILHLVSSGGQENMFERVLYLAGPFGFALLAGALSARLGSLWIAVGIHAGMHVSTMVNSLLGMGEGPVLWVVQGALYTVVAVVLMVKIPRSQPASTLQYGAAAR